MNKKQLKALLMQAQKLHKEDGLSKEDALDAAYRQLAKEVRKT